MDNEHAQYHQRDTGSGGSEEQGLFDTEEFVAPGAPIVRSSTPRPQTFELFTYNAGQPQAAQPAEHDALSAFPMEAPSAPPLPEEFGEPGDDALHSVEESSLLPAGRIEPVGEVPSEFFWLFEYALQMDISFLNSPERLNGQALLYGPAVLKGYELTFDVISAHNGPVAATILPSRKRGAEVWGVLYRIPRALVEQLNTEPALLDRIHAAVSPHNLFERIQIVVHEMYRVRDVRCITYIATAAAHNQFHLLPREKQIIDMHSRQRLLESARKLKFPDAYLSELTALLTAQDDVDTQREVPVSTVEQNTEPLLVLKDEKRTAPSASSVQLIRPYSHLNIGLMIFALYLVLTLLGIFTLAVIQGLGIGNHLFTLSFAPLGIPWYVLVYGLMGGCLSCIVALGRFFATRLPNFVLITWYSRPYFGVVLAGLVYLLLNTGLFTLGGSPEQHTMLFSLLAVLAGACEGWLFFRRT